jgi:hypothetical protein
LWDKALTYCTLEHLVIPGDFIGDLLAETPLETRLALILLRGEAGIELFLTAEYLWELSRFLADF